MTAYEIKKLVPDYWNKHKEKLIYTSDRQAWFDWEDLFRIDRDYFHNPEHARSMFQMQDDEVCYRRLASREMSSLFRNDYYDFDMGTDCKISNLLYQKERQRASINEPYGAWIESVDKEANFGINFMKGVRDAKHIETSVGKWLRSLDFLDAVTDSEIENYVNKLKSKYVLAEEFSIVTGEDIREWYHGERYSYNTGTLSQSCMRHERCQDFFDIYVENDIQMLILTNQNGLLVGRALLWHKSLWNKNYFDNCDMFMDRIYGNDRVIQKFKNYAKQKGWARKSEQTYNNTVGVHFNGEDFTKRMRMNIEYTAYDEYPYMDTFNRLGEGCLKNHGDGTILDSTEGSYSEPYAYCSECSCSIQCEDDAYYNSHDGEYFCSEHSVYSEWYETYIQYSDAIETEDGWIYAHDSVEDSNGHLHHEDNVCDTIFGETYSKNVLYSIRLQDSRLYVQDENLLRNEYNDLITMVIDGYRCKAIDFNNNPVNCVHAIENTVQRIEYDGNVYITTYRSMCEFIKLNISQHAEA